MRCVVTGGAGFIGRELSRLLEETGHSVAILDDLSSPNSAPPQSSVDFHFGCITDQPLVRSVVRSADCVFHLAGISSISAVSSNLERATAVNERAAIAVAQECAFAGAKFVFSSSAAVYGNQPTLPVSEDAEAQPLSHYGKQKLAVERFLQSEAIDSVSLRYFNVFGPGQVADAASAGVITLFVHACCSGAALAIHGDGRAIRDFVHVADAARANLCGALSTASNGRAFNVASGVPVSVEDLANLIREVCGVEGPLRFDEPRGDEIRDSWADTRRAKTELAFAASGITTGALRDLVDQSIRSKRAVTPSNSG